MNSAKHWINRVGLALAATVLVFNLSVAHAVVITASTTFDDVTVNDFSFGATSGTFNVVSGGATTTATYAGDTASANPLSGPLTDIYDGSGFTGTASATNAEFAIGFDTEISALNNTSSTQTVVFRLDFSNRVNADGSDAFADSELTLNDDNGEIFFSDLKSDTSFGDAVGGISTGQSGDVLDESGVLFFSYILNSSETVNLFMNWTLEGGDFAGGLAEADLSANLTVVPLPGSLLFMLSGMLLLPLQRLMRR